MILLLYGGGDGADVSVQKVIPYRRLLAPTSLFCVLCVRRPCSTVFLFHFSLLALWKIFDDVFGSDELWSRSFQIATPSIDFHTKWLLKKNKKTKKKSINKLKNRTSSSHSAGPSPFDGWEIKTTRSSFFLSCISTPHSPKYQIAAYYYINRVVIDERLGLGLTFLFSENVWLMTQIEKFPQRMNWNPSDYQAKKNFNIIKIDSAPCLFYIKFKIQNSKWKKKINK